MPLILNNYSLINSERTLKYFKHIALINLIFKYIALEYSTRGLFKVKNRGLWANHGIGSTLEMENS